MPYCSVHCPLHNHIPDWLRLTAEGRLREAYELSNATSTMPEICGRICPQDRLCEGNCVIEFSGHGAVTIGSVEKFITDKAWDEGWVEPVRVGPARGQSVGVIGAGPAGLSAAEYLREMGYDVHIYDRHDRAGGLLTYGIPGFKLEKHVVMRRVARLQEAGIVFHNSFEVGRDASLDELRAKHDTILIATGVYKARGIKAPGVGASGVVEALDYLTASNRKSFGDHVPAFEDGSLNAEGKNVVVVGGGDTAMDCVRTAIRQGAKSIRQFEREDRQVVLEQREQAAGNNAEQGGGRRALHLFECDVEGGCVPAHRHPDAASASRALQHQRVTQARGLATSVLDVLQQTAARQERQPRLLRELDAGVFAIDRSIRRDADLDELVGFERPLDLGQHLLGHAFRADDHHRLELVRLRLELFDLHE